MELEAQRSRVEQHERHEAATAQERAALDQQHLKAEDAAHRQVGQGWRDDTSSLPKRQPLQPASAWIDKVTGPTGILYCAK